ncbi:integral membrane domain protein [Mycobacterium kansasii]|uniref:Integral membrane domain protein n=2 Tax=Mycobacterium TaxID=1763 RepID=A0A1V3X4P7_MYCKA|nr:integral membrane domain protein [Mycobacterium kansasii]
MVFVLAVSQLVQIMVVALLTAVIYVMLGLIVLSSALLDEWTRGAPSSSTVLGLTFPVPDSLIHMCLFLGALTFMYISARAVDDAEYRTTFVDPLIDDLHATLIARNRYHASITGYSPRVDAADHSD